MNTPNNAAHEAVQAKPCPRNTQASQALTTRATENPLGHFLFEASDQAARVRSGNQAIFALSHFVEVAESRNAAPEQELAELILLLGEALDRRATVLADTIEAGLQAWRELDAQGGVQ